MSHPRMSLHIGDYRKDTGHLRAAGHGAYLLLIFHYWATGSLPDDDDELAAIACMTTREWTKHKRAIQALFKPGWRHKRIDEEIAEANKRYKRRSQAGQSGNAKRWGPQTDPNATAGVSQCDPNATTKASQCDPNATDVGSQCDRNPNPNPNPNPEKKDDVVVVARAREPLLSEQALSLADELAVIVGYPDHASWPPGWYGTAMRVQMWLNAGWPPAIIVIAVRRAMAKPQNQADRPESAKFFEREISREIARQKQPLPEVTVIEGVHVRENSGSSYPGGEYGRERDRRKERGRAVHAALGRYVAESKQAEQDGGGGGPPAEILPPAGDG